MKKIETILRKDLTIFGKFDYLDLLQLRLDIITGIITEELYFLNNHGGIDIIDEFGCSNYNYFEEGSKMLYKIVQEQMRKRIKYFNKTIVK